MRVMVVVKASKESEAGEMPSEKLLAEMGKFNEELVKAGVMLAAGAGRTSAVQVLGRQADRHRRAVRRDEGADRRLLAVAGEVDGRGRRVAQARAHSTRARRSRFARCSRPRTSARSSRPSCARRRSGCAPRSSDRRTRRAGADRCPRPTACARIAPSTRLADRVREADRRPRAHRPRRGPRRGPGAGGARRRARAVAGRRHPGQPRRLAHGDGEEPRHRPAPAAASCSSASTRSSDELGAPAIAPDLEAALDDGRGRRPAPARLHRLSPRAVHGRRAWRSRCGSSAGSRPTRSRGPSSSRSRPSRSASSARSGRSPRRGCRSRCRAARSSPTALVGARGHLPRVQRGLLGHRGRRLDAAGAVRGRAAAGAHPRRARRPARPRCTASSR